MDNEGRARAGAWLKRERERRRISVRRIAAHFDVSTQSVYGWESGGSAFVTDDRAAGIAEVLGMDLIEVRRNLGLWVPPNTEQAGDVEQEDVLAALSPAERELVERIAADPRKRRHLLDAILATHGHTPASTEHDTSEHRGHRAS